jgi:hypothetical protein
VQIKGSQDKTPRQQQQQIHRYAHHNCLRLFAIVSGVILGISKASSRASSEQKISLMVLKLR